MTTYRQCIKCFSEWHGMGPICNECRQIEAITNQTKLTQSIAEEYSNRSTYSSPTYSASNSSGDYYIPKKDTSSLSAFNYAIIALFLIAVSVSAYNDGSFWHFIVSLFSFLQGIMSGILWVIGFCLGIKVEVIGF